MKLLILAAFLSILSPAVSDARPPRDTEITPPPPINDVVAVVRHPFEQQAQVMSARLTLLNGVFYSKYATVTQ